MNSSQTNVRVLFKPSFTQCVSHVVPHWTVGFSSFTCLFVCEEKTDGKLETKTPRNPRKFIFPSKMVTQTSFFSALKMLMLLWLFLLLMLLMLLTANWINSCQLKSIFCFLKRLISQYLSVECVSMPSRSTLLSVCTSVHQFSFPLRPPSNQWFPPSWHLQCRCLLKSKSTQHHKTIQERSNVWRTPFTIKASAIASAPLSPM